MEGPSQTPWTCHANEALRSPNYAWLSLDVENEVLGEIGAELVPARDGQRAGAGGLAANCDAILTFWMRDRGGGTAAREAHRALVSTMRGAVVDQAALAQALREGWTAGAGLDVLAAEPPDLCEPLLALNTRS